MTTYQILFYKTDDNYVERRKPFRANHLDMVREGLDDGSLIMGGALADPADEAIIVFKDKASAENFVENDPYVQNGLIKEWKIRPWNVFRTSSDFEQI